MDNFKITKTILENINEQNDRINECVDIVNGYTTDEETRVSQELQRQENELRREEQYNNNENRFTVINEQLDKIETEIGGEIVASKIGFIDDGVTPNNTIFEDFKIKYPNCILKFTKETQGVYYFNGGRPNLGGVKILADKDVKIKIDANPNLKEMYLLSDLIIKNRVHLTELKKPKNVIENECLYNISSGFLDFNLKEKSTLINFTEWKNDIFIPTSGQFMINQGTATKEENKISWTNTFSNSQVVYPPTLEDGTFYECNILTDSDTRNKMGVLIKTSEKIYYANLVTGGSILEILEIGLTGGILNNKTIQLPNGAGYGLTPSQEQNIGFIKKDNYCYVLICDTPFFKVKGTIEKVGFLARTIHTTTGIIFKDGIKTENYSIKHKKPLKVAMVGDSISYGAWNTIAPENLMKIMLENSPQVGYVVVKNFSVSGTSTREWKTKINEISFSGFNYVTIMLGTNDCQGSVPVSEYVANLKIIADKIVSDGAIPVFDVFPIFTAPGVSGVTGVTTTNYNLHAKYTQSLKVFCLKNGYLYGNGRKNFGTNIKWYGDNIHPIEQGQIGKIASWVEVINRDILTRL